MIVGLNYSPMDFIKEIIIMLENLQQHCKEHKELLTHAKVTLIIEN